MKTAFIGHRKLYNSEIKSRLEQAVYDEIKNGSTIFTMGTHGEFDKLALSVCSNFKTQFRYLQIEVVYTSLHKIQRDHNLDYISNTKYETIMYDIESAYFKQQITLSNRQMIDSCETLICYVDGEQCRSGAKATMNFAKNRGLRIINLFRKEDKPFYGMTKEEIAIYKKNFLTKN